MRKKKLEAEKSKKYNSDDIFKIEKQKKIKYNKQWINSLQRKYIKKIFRGRV